MKIGKRDEIIAAAEKRFIKHGYGKTTLNEIARDLRMGKASLYHYFDTKDTLYYASVSKQVTDYLNSLKELLNSSDVSANETIIKFFRIKYSFKESYKLLHQILIHYFTDSLTAQEENVIKSFFHLELELMQLFLGSIIKDEYYFEGEITADIVCMIGNQLVFGNKLLSHLLPEKMRETEEVMFSRLLAVVFQKTTGNSDKDLLLGL